MSEPLATAISRSAAKLVELATHRGAGAVLDFSQASLILVEEMAAEAAQWTSTISPDQLTTLIQDIGCYLLEVGRHEFGGQYLWHELHDQPVLVVGEPAFHVALMTWNKVRGRLGGDPADNLPFFYDGFAEKARLRIGSGGHITHGSSEAGVELLPRQAPSRNHGRDHTARRKGPTWPGFRTPTASLHHSPARAMLG